MLGLLLCTVSFAMPVPKEADYVLINGSIYTQDQHTPWAEALAVRDGKIVYLGRSDQAKKITARISQIDLNGKMVLPGFIEAHIHPTFGVLTQGVDLQTDSLATLLMRVKQYASANPDQLVITGFGWRYGLFPSHGPNKALLDQIVPDRPVFLLAIDGHSAWVNSKALAMAKIDAHTPDPQPPFSIFQRDDQQQPTGYLIG